MDDEITTSVLIEKTEDGKIEDVTIEDAIEETDTLDGLALLVLELLLAGIVITLVIIH